MFGGSLGSGGHGFSSSGGGMLNVGTAPADRYLHVGVGWYSGGYVESWELVVVVSGTLSLVLIVSSNSCPGTCYVRIGCCTYSSDCTWSVSSCHIALRQSLQRTWKR